LAEWSDAMCVGAKVDRLAFDLEKKNSKVKTKTSK
jgi:hypothetical protein